MGDVIRYLTIRGRVQGVGYRIWVMEQARGLGLTGWVRNRRDGSVEAVISGSSEKIDSMIALCRSGPTLARIDAVDSEIANEEALLSLWRPGENFSILPTL